MKPATSMSPFEKIHSLACMEIVGGISAFEGGFRTPDMDFHVSTKPFREGPSGADVRYISLCGGGITTRMLLADISGHGAHVREFSEELRRLVKRHINAKNQAAFMETMNREFTEYAAMRRFATAIAATWLGPANALQLSIAGHPRPFVYRSRSKRWLVLGEGPELPLESVGTSDLPIGIDEDPAYGTFEMELDPGDLLVYYTDALTEAQSPESKLLGEAGLLDMLAETVATHEGLDAISRHLLEAVADYRAGEPAEDDETLILARVRKFEKKPFDIGEKVRVYGKFFGLLDY